MSKFYEIKNIAKVFKNIYQKKPLKYLKKINKYKKNISKYYFIKIQNKYIKFLK